MKFSYINRFVSFGFGNNNYVKIIINDLLEVVSFFSDDSDIPFFSILQLEYQISLNSFWFSTFPLNTKAQSNTP